MTRPTKTEREIHENYIRSSRERLAALKGIRARVQDGTDTARSADEAITYVQSKINEALRALGAS